MNTCCFTGHLTENPVVTYTRTGKLAVKFTLTVARRWAREGDVNTDVLKFVVWGDKAKAASEAVKGMALAVTGEYHVREYEVQGRQSTSHEIACDTVEIVADQEPEFEDAGHRPPVREEDVVEDAPF